MVEKVFFQSSMPRALSTVFQNIMHQNPDFYVTPTSGLLELWFAARANYTDSLEFRAQDSELMKKAFAGFCREGMFGYFNQLTDRKYVLDKSRGHGTYRGFIDTFYPNPKIICLVRNIKDVMASYEKIYRKNQDKHDPVRNDSTGRGITVHKRIDEWTLPTSTIGRAIERIGGMFSEGYDKKILFVKSEDLCLHPETEMQRVYDYLELPYFQHDFDNIEQFTKEDDAVYGLATDLHTIRPALEMKKSDAHSILGDDICKWLKDRYRWYYDAFDYR